jgi:3-oxoacyl-[acyl-carrier-protein] synthase-3
MKRAAIVGLGRWLPETVRRNDFWPADFASGAGRKERVLTDIISRQSDPYAPIVQRHVQAEAGDPFVGTRERRIAPRRFESREAEARAAEAALADAGLSGSEVDVVLSYAATPEQPAIISSHWIAHRIGARGAMALGIEAACASALVQLKLAQGLVASGQAKVVLGTQSFLMTRTMPERHPASPNIGDAATAFVVTASERQGVRAVVSISHGEYHDAVVWDRQEQDPAPWWEPGGAMRILSHDLETAESLVARTVQFGVDTIGRALAEAGATAVELDALVTVQPRSWIAAAVAEGLGMDPARAVTTFDELAHVGACGVVANLIAARERGLSGPGRTVACYAQGAGFVRAAAVLDC